MDVLMGWMWRTVDREGEGARERQRQTDAG